MNIEYITHASLLLRTEEFSLLTDPCYFLEPFFATNLFHFPPRKLTPEMFGNLNYVYSSHIHVDHSHPETIKQLKNQIDTVLLPAKRPDLEKRYRDIGYNKIILLQNGETLQLNDTVEVTSYWDDPVDTILLVKIQDQVILHQNDCKLTPRTLSKIADRFHIDYAFLLYTTFANHQPTLLYGLPEDMSKQVADDEEEFLKYQVELLRILKPQTIIPYSMTLSYCQPDQLHFNGYQRMTPTIFISNILAHLPQTKYFILQPGDIIDLELEQVKSAHNKNFWGENLQEYLHNISKYVQEENIPKFNFGDSEENKEIIANYLQQLLTSTVPDLFINQVIVLEVIGNEHNMTYIIDFPHQKIFLNNSQLADISNNYFVKLSIPASIVEQLIANNLNDSLMDFILYSNRVTLKVNYHKQLSIKAKFGLFIKTLLFIFGNR
ncbi:MULTISPECIES: MBL fold metallo-hydrolase [unclassified Anabaena]|uniref:MBL fold metallo-hydrolase n=1 Tax=unclassified Anabaena TaxID=2619674 RepID=UPI000832D990|nr:MULTISPECIES: MBL fold metallo-hydrolase [unclassified Anabaena]